jgi:hypothetical protein
MSEFIDRQINQLKKLVDDYRSANITLNKFIMGVEAILALSEMSNFRNELEERVAILEEINAYLIDGGQKTDKISQKIDEQISFIENEL